MITDSVDSLGVRTNSVIGALRIASPHHFGAIIVSQRMFRILPSGPNGLPVRACPFSMVCTSERIFKGIGIGRHSNLRNGSSDLGSSSTDGRWPILRRLARTPLMPRVQAGINVGQTELIGV